jgi:hypothetical protein
MLNIEKKLRRLEKKLNKYVKKEMYKKGCAYISECHCFLYYDLHDCVEIKIEYASDSEDYKTQKEIKMNIMINESLEFLLGQIALKIEENENKQE